MQKGRFFIWLLALFAVIGLLTGSALAAGKGSGYGMLSSVEDDGTIIIDGKGYYLSPAAMIRNSRGERITLRSMALPESVYFEYHIITKGFEITLIKLSPR